MPAKEISAPAGEWSNRHQAAAWLGITEAEFDRAAKEYPQFLPAHKWGKQQNKWYWLDLVTFSWLRTQGRLGPPAEG